MPPFLRALTVISVVISTGCATMSVSSHVQRGLDFAQYRTFGWGTPDELPISDPRLDRNPYFRDLVEGAIERQLGLRELEMSTTPDVRVHYHATVTNRLTVSHIVGGRGYCYTGTCHPEVSEYEAGTLVIDFVEVRTNRVIWRGWAQDALDEMLDDRDTMREKIDEAVTRMLARWPGRT